MRCARRGLTFVVGDQACESTDEQTGDVPRDNRLEIPALVWDYSSSDDQFEIIALSEIIALALYSLQVIVFGQCGQ